MLTGFRKAIYRMRGHYPGRLGGEAYRLDPYHSKFWRKASAGDWEPATFAVLDAHLRPDRDYIDIGAWIGPTVLYAARKARHVWCFEPDPTAFRALSWNLELNGIENVLRVLMYLFLAAFLGLGLGLLSGAVKLYWPNWSTFQSVLMRIMFFTSGKFFLADSLPRTLQEWLWYNPMLHVTEGVRSAFFRGFESRFLDPAYPVLCMLLLLFLGLASERVSRGKLMRV